MKGKLAEPVDVLRRVGDAVLVQYRCFRLLPDNKYWVEGAERYELPLSEEEREGIRRQSEAVLTAAPFSPGDEAGAGLGRLYDSLEEAVAAFEADYSRPGR